MAESPESRSRSIAPQNTQPGRSDPWETVALLTTLTLILALGMARAPVAPSGGPLSGGEGSLGAILTGRPWQPATPTGTAGSDLPCAREQLFLPLIQRPRNLPFRRATAAPRQLGPACPRPTDGAPGSATPTGRGTATGTPAGSATAGPSPRPSSTGSPQPTASGTAVPEPSPTLPAPVLGLQAFESDLGPLNRGLADAVTWVRLRALWAAIEPVDQAPPRYNWGMSDSMIAAAAARGLRPVVVVYTAPDWAATQPCGPVDKVPLARYQDFVRALVERYDGDGQADAPGSPVIRYWEIGNEPDLSQSRRGQEDYGSCFGDSPAAYGAQLRAAWLGARAADPAAQILFGAVAYERFHNGPESYRPKGPFNFDFVRQVLEQLHDAHGGETGWPFFQLMAFHNYNDFRHNWDAPDGSQPEILGKAAQLREQQMRVAGKFDLRQLPLFVSEVGLPSAPSDAYTLRSEDYQAAYVGQVFARSAAAGARGAIWFSLTDLLPDPSRPDCANPYAWLSHGLLRSRVVAQAAAACPTPPLPGYRVDGDVEAKPSWQALGTAGRLLAGASFERRLDFAETGDLAIEAYRFRRPDGSALLVAFTDHGERLGKRDQEDLTAQLSLGPALLPGWTGRLRVTDYLGRTQQQSGASLPVALDHRPRYVEVAP